MKPHQSFLATITLLLVVVWGSFPAVPALAAARVHYVWADVADATQDGSSWEHAYSDLQAALAAAAAGDEIWVAQGTYTPAIDSSRTNTFVLKTGVAIYGGFGGTETSREQRDWRAYRTILSGDIGVPGDTSDNSYQVVSSKGVDASAVLDGFTVRRGACNSGDSVERWTASRPTAPSPSK